MFEKFDIDDKNIFKVCVVATMSSGKSTFINSIIGEEVMPEKNEACTARTMAVLDNDMATTKKAHIIRKNGTKEVVVIDSRAVLDQINNDEDVVDFLVETNIQSIDNTSRALMLVDTPGVNNSEDERHGERTEEFLKQMDTGVIIYLLNATQLATNDDSILLQLVSEHVKKNGNGVKIIFVINKIDALDLETESIANTVNIAKKYIEKHGIPNPVIYPLSALAAKSLRMALYRRKMTRREMRKLEDTYNHYQSKDNNMLAYAITDELSDEIYEIGDIKVTAQELQRAIDNTGITAVEKRLASFMREVEQHYSPEIVIKSQLSENASQAFQNRLNDIAIFPEACKWDNFKSTNELVEKSDVIQRLNKNISNLDNLVINIDLSSGLEFCSSDINDLLNNIEEIKIAAFDIFKAETYIGVKRIKGFFFCPEKDLSNRITIKAFYLMSEDGYKWKPVQFGPLTRAIESGKTVYLYNEYSTLVFAVSPESGADIIALLDTKIPVRYLKIAGLSGERVSISKVIEYVNAVESDAQLQKAKIEAAEEQLKRTYKGIVFESEEKKAEIIRLEQELIEYCESLEQRNYVEIWEKKEQIAQLPNSIFAGYVSKLLSGLDIQENREKNIYLEQIEVADLNELDTILKKLDKEYYSDGVKRTIASAVENRRLICQRIVLEMKLKDFETNSRTDLMTLLDEVKNIQFDSKLIAEFSERIIMQSEFVEKEELRELCKELEEKSAIELKQLENLIRAGGYQEKFTEQYYQMIDARKEFLCIKGMEQLCIPIASVDRSALLSIENKINDMDCKQELKKKYLDLVFERRERLDYEDLCELTTNLNSKSVNEIESVLSELKSGKYNDKFVKCFLVKCRLFLEMAQLDSINSLVKHLDEIDKQQVISILQSIEKQNYVNRVDKLARDRIAERIYELDLIELINTRNEFDTLSLDDIRNLRNLIKQKNVSDRAIYTYEKKLKERELVAAFQLVSPLSCLIKQTINQYGLGGLNISIATFSPDYIALLKNHFEELGKEDFEDIPAFFYIDCCKLALSKKYLFCKSNSKYLKIQLSDIRAFGIEKKLFQEVISVSLVNGNIITLSGGLNKSFTQAVVGFLSYIHQNVSNDALLSRYQPYTDHIVELTNEQFEKKDIPKELSEKVIVGILVDKLNKLNSIPSVKYIGAKSWTANCNKACSGFGISNDELVLYYDRSLLGSAKDGFALGLRNFYIRTGQQLPIIISIKDLYSAELENGKLVLMAQDNNKYFIDFSLSDERSKKEIVKYLDEYIKGIQLLSALSTGGPEVKIREDVYFTEGKTCPNCKAQLKVGANFCAQCGTKIFINEVDKSDEFFFCSECGNKIIKGKKFCSQCGTRVEG